MLALFSPALASAQYVLASVTGGHTTSNNGDPINYSGNNLAYGGHRSANVVSASGQVTMVFAWDGDKSKVPKRVIVSKIVSAGSQAVGIAPPTGACANGLGDAPVESLTQFEGMWIYSCLSIGQTYSIVTGAMNLTVTVNPSSSCSSDWLADTGVDISVQLLPVKVNLAGTTQHESEDTILQGQRCTSALVIEGQCAAPLFPNHSHGYDITIVGSDWEVTGDKFLDFEIVPGVSGHTVYPAPPHWLQDSPYWYWKGPAGYNPGGDDFTPETVAGQGIASCAEGPLGFVSAKAKPAVFRPQYTMSAVAVEGPHWDTTSNPGQVWIRAGDWNNGVPGMEIWAHVDTQEWFELGNDHGTFYFNQLISAHRARDGLQIPGWWFDDFRLDASFPYDGYYPAFGLNYSINDNPGQERSYSYYCSDHFETALGYAPPRDSSKVTPLETGLWTWNSSGTAPFPPNPTGATTTGGRSPTNLHQEWDAVRTSP